LKKLIRIFKHGIHFGEEQQVQGNDNSGVIYFSGCHLACNFCYTPETSKEKIGTDYNQDEFLDVLYSLVDRGAKNINLITPTHIWGQIKAPLTKFKNVRPDVPVILKTSGYQNKNIATEMSHIGDIIVMDFKLLNSHVANEVNIPENYGKLALEQVVHLSNENHNEFSEDKMLTKGLLIRHLIMPKFFDETIAVINALNKSNFKGILNILTIFIDPLTKKISKLDKEKIAEVTKLVNLESYQLLVNGKQVG